MTKSRRPIGVMALVLFHLLNVVLWFIGQTLAISNFDMVAGWGLQEPRALVDPVIVEVNRAIALADTVLLIPLFIVAAVGLMQLRFYGAVASWIVLGWSLYWPAVFWASQFFYSQTGIKHAPTGMDDVIVPGALWIIAAWGIFYLYRQRGLFD